jgi:hypothetical protein
MLQLFSVFTSLEFTDDDCYWIFFPEQTCPNAHSNYTVIYCESFKFIGLQCRSE